MEVDEGVQVEVKKVYRRVLLELLVLDSDSQVHLVIHSKHEDVISKRELVSIFGRHRLPSSLD